MKVPRKVWTEQQHERPGLHSPASASDPQLEEEKMTADGQFQAGCRETTPGWPVKFAKELSSYEAAHP